MLLANNKNNNCNVKITIRIRIEKICTNIRKSVMKGLNEDIVDNLGSRRKSKVLFGRKRLYIIL